MRYGVSEEIWKHFSREILDAAVVPGLKQKCSPMSHLMLGDSMLA
jgi:hypothetical protein